MKAVQIHQYGGPEELKWEDAPMPEIGPDDVLVKVYASGVNPVDWKIRQGHMKEQMQYTFPLIVGWDMAGTVEKVGDNVKDFKEGDEVYGRPDLSRNGTYAEYVAVKASAIGPKPGSVDFVTAAAIPLAALTAWQGIIDHGKVQSGKKVLIQGASGGVGMFAVQIAKWKGAFVIGTASKENVKFLEDLGIDQVIDYHEPDFEDRLKDVNVLFDTVGGEQQKKLLNVMKPDGVVVSTVGITDQSILDARGLKGVSYMATSTQADLKQLADLVDQGKLKVHISKVFPIQEAAEAHKLGEEGHTQGKVVLQVV